MDLGLGGLGVLGVFGEGGALGLKGLRLSCGGLGGLLLEDFLGGLKRLCRWCTTLALGICSSTPVV